MDAGAKRGQIPHTVIISFNSTSEACANFLDKGRLVAIQGRVQTREYEDREGTKHQVMQVVAEKVTFLGAAKREEPDDRRPSPGQPREKCGEQGASDEEAPF